VIGWILLLSFNLFIPHFASMNVDALLQNYKKRSFQHLISLKLSDCASCQITTISGILTRHKKLCLSFFPKSTLNRSKFNFGVASQPCYYHKHNRQWSSLHVNRLIGYPPRLFSLKLVSSFPSVFLPVYLTLRYKIFMIDGYY